MTSKTSRTLYVCKSETEACLKAVQAWPIGFAVYIFEEDGLQIARTGTVSMFGPVVRSFDAPDYPMLRSLVIDTLSAGQSDVFLCCSDEHILTKLFDDAEAIDADDIEISVSTVVGSVPQSLSWPMSVFSDRKLRAPVNATGTVTTYCTLTPGPGRPHLEPESKLWMGAQIEKDTTTIYYFDDLGAFVGLHGNVKRVLSDDELARIEEIVLHVTTVSWGRDKNLQNTQVAFFELPDDVDAMLADAKISKDLSPA